VDDVEKEKSEKEEQKKEAAPRKKVDKKDKEKHGKQNTKAAPVSADARPKKHEGFDRRPGPGPQRKVDKRTGAGKWDQDQQRIVEDQFRQDSQDDLAGQDGQGDAKDAKDSKDLFDLDEWKAVQERKRPDGDALKPRAPRTDGDFREVKEFKKEKN